jgi:hypothetical protein
MGSCLSPQKAPADRPGLRANQSLSGLDEAQLELLTGWTPQRLASTLQVDGASPADVWRLRDVLEQAAIRAGKTPVPYTVLTETAQAAARGWFGIWG